MMSDFGSGRGAAFAAQPDFMLNSETTEMPRLRGSRRRNIWRAERQRRWAMRSAANFGQLTTGLTAAQYQQRVVWD